MARAFAKVILFGEHAVVHGRTAVAAALDRGARAVARITGPESAGPSKIEVEPWGHVATTDDETNEVSRAFRALLSEAAPGQRVEARVDVDVPGGAGLGCSAAIGVALARAIGQARGSPMGDDVAAAHATAWERVFHGNPSGVDVAIAARGGVIAFNKSSFGSKALFPPAPMELAVASTGEASSTKAMVEQVARQLARRPQVVERTFDGIEALALKGAAAIEGARWYEVGRLMDLNHALLASLLVSTEALENACNIARGAGAAGAKLTGGGGGGCAIALAPGKVDAVLEAWRSAGIDGFAATIAPSPALFVPAVGGDRA